ncbi:RNA polymerase sigma factor [Tuwongella immobilis]|nr:sigma-70 family RNA polymerase sigma factor [Tuwongella immobilis]
MLANLISAHAAPLVLFARQWCALPDDVVQEAFVQLHLQQPPPDDPVAWLYRVVRNRAVSASRSDRRRRDRESRRAVDAGWFQPAPDGDRLDRIAAMDALQELPLPEREIIIAHLWGGLTFAQIGGLVDCSAATAFRRYQTALQQLRTRLGVSCPNSN